MSAACGYDYSKFAASGADAADGSGDAAVDGAGDGAGGDSGGPAESGADGPGPAGDTGARDGGGPDATARDASDGSALDSSRDADAAEAAALYTVGGTITGLTASGLRLSNLGGAPVTILSGATAFNFPPQPDGTPYAVTIASPPSGLSCSVSQGSGTVAGASVTSVVVACIPTPACAPTCPDGNLCGAPTDCGSQVCTGGACQPPACSPSCHHGQACGGNGDCQHGSCTGGTCQ